MSAMEIPQLSCTFESRGSLLNVQMLRTRPLHTRTHTHSSESDAVALGWGLRNCSEVPAGDSEHNQKRA